ncbi:MAG: DinB family protein [Bacteroidota bacterium]|nr:DinB family protein [Bacteroidota bacterium]
MLIHLKLILLSLLLLSKGLYGQSSFLEDYKLKWKNTMEYTLEFAQIMPEDNYAYTPTKVEMNYGEQLKHLAGNMVWLCSSYLQGEKTAIDPLKSGISKKEIISVLEKSFAYANKTIGNLTEADLNEPVDFFAGKMSRRRILFLLTDHVTHHRGQLVVYLRMKNIEPPNYRGW